MFQELPEDVRRHARRSYRLFMADHRHNGLYFKPVIARRRICSARIGDNYRVVGIVTGGDILWFWIGPHDDYLRLLRRLR